MKIQEYTWKFLGIPLIFILNFYQFQQNWAKILIQLHEKYTGIPKFSTARINLHETTKNPYILMLQLWISYYLWPWKREGEFHTFQVFHTEYEPCISSSMWPGFRHMTSHSRGQHYIPLSQPGDIKRVMRDKSTFKIIFKIF